MSAVALTITFFLSACGGDDSPADPAYATAARPQINQSLNDSLTPGAVVYVQSPNGDWLESFGTAVRGTNTPIPTNAHFRVGSITKTWTGTVALQLVQEGKLALADPVAKYIPNVPNGNTITIQQLLGMRSGLYNYTRSLAFAQAVDAQPDRVWTPQELLDIAYAQPPDFTPGTDFAYSNTNTVLLGQVIEQVTGMSAADVMRARLFAPLGLTDTFLPPQTDTSMPAPAPHGYQWGTAVETLDSSALSPARQAAAKSGALQPTDVTSMSASQAWTAGTGVSTVKELAAIARRMVEGGYLGADLQTTRLNTCTPAVAPDPSTPRYCLGIAKMGAFYGHTGQIPGFNTFMGHDPVTHTTVIVYATVATAPDGTPPADAIAKIVIASLASAR